MSIQSLFKNYGILFLLLIGGVVMVLFFSFGEEALQSSLLEEESGIIVIAPDEGVDPINTGFLAASSAETGVVLEEEPAPELESEAEVDVEVEVVTSEGSATGVMLEEESETVMITNTATGDLMEEIPPLAPVIPEPVLAPPVLPSEPMEVSLSLQLEAMKPASAESEPEAEIVPELPPITMELEEPTTDETAQDIRYMLTAEAAESDMVPRTTSTFEEVPLTPETGLPTLMLLLLSMAGAAGLSLVKIRQD